MATSTQRQSVCVTHGDGEQVNIRCLCEGLVVGPGMSNHQGSRLPEDCLDLVSEGARSKATRIGVAPVAAANLSTACWPVFLDDISRVFNGNNGMSCRQKLLLGSLQIYDVDAITFLFVPVLYHLEVRIGAT